MKTEFEVRILNIDINEMINKWISIGADFLGVFFKTYMYMILTLLLWSDFCQEVN